MMGWTCTWDREIKNAYRILKRSSTFGKPRK
jgi:hypothetical protein